MNQGLDVDGMQALLSLQRAECDRLTREVQSLKSNQVRSQQLVSQQLAGICEELRVPAHRQALEMRRAEAIANGNSCWAHQACVGIDFLLGLLLDTEDVSHLQHNMSILQHAHENLQVSALRARFLDCRRP
jgi:hypothetical protein